MLGGKLVGGEASFLIDFSSCWPAKNDRKLMIFCEVEDKELLLPSPKLSTDNAAMICVAAKNNLITNELGLDDIRLSSVISY